MASGKLDTKYSWCVFYLLLAYVFYFFYFHYTILFNANENQLGTEPEIFINGDRESKTNHPHKKENKDPCLGKYIYVHDLPSRFNDDIIKNCFHTGLQDICESISNNGFGPQLNNTYWYKTSQFVLEIIFHHRMKQYKCLTNDSSKASAIYVPYYAGLDIARFRHGKFPTSVRDTNPNDLVNWLARKAEWKTMWGGDHFFVSGRITWDFRRPVDDDTAWGNKLMLLPEAKNMTMLTIESSPWSDKDVSIPYPTYFHPSGDDQLSSWKERIRRKTRPYLFCFIGAPRHNAMQISIRDEIINQCLSSSANASKLVLCNSTKNQCHDQVYVMQVLQKSTFCLQPPGDSYTRQSTFLSIIAGCIPVFFNPGSIYMQYTWHLPRNHTKYSLLIQEDDIMGKKSSIAKLLVAISSDGVSSLRNEVVELIPKVAFADPRSKLERKFEDAFDVAIKGVLDRVENNRQTIKEGKNSTQFEDDNWSYYLYGIGAEFPYELLSNRTDNSVPIPYK